MKYQQPYGAAADAAYVNGNPAAGVQGSIPPAEAFEHPQRELAAFIAASGMTPSAADLTQIQKAARAQRLNFFSAAGTANALTIAPSPAFASMVDLVGVPLRIMVGITSTGAATLNVNGLGAYPICRPTGAPTQAGDLLAGTLVEILSDGATFCLTAPPAAIQGGTAAFQASGTLTVPTGVTQIICQVWGAGGGGASGSASGAAGSGGGGGGYAYGTFRVTPGQVIPVTVGTGGASVSGATNGNTGGTTSIGSLISATGGGGGFYSGGGTQPSVGSAGNGSGGQVNLQGQSGGASQMIGSVIISGFGGAAGLGGAGGPGSTVSGGSGGGPGGGGAGGVYPNPSSNGAGGMAIITY